MVKDLFIGKMDHLIMEVINMESNMVMVHLIILQRNIIKGNGQMVNKMVKESYLIKIIRR